MNSEEFVLIAKYLGQYLYGEEDNFKVESIERISRYCPVYKVTVSKGIEIGVVTEVILLCVNLDKPDSPEIELIEC